MSLYISALGLNKIDLVSTNLENFAYSNIIDSLTYNYSNLNFNVVSLSNSLSNYETILNNGYSNNSNAISALSISSSNFITANQNIELKFKILDANSNTFLNLPAATNYNGTISNLSNGYSNNSNAISSLSVLSSNYETKSSHNSDISSLNSGISNNSLQIISLSAATSNFETILNHDLDLVQINNGYSNNSNAISALSITSSNFITANQTIELKNKTMSFNSNIFVGFPNSGSSYYYDTLELGSIVDFAGTSAPTGWLLCYGQDVSRTTYANLFAIIGTTFGIGDGTTTFNLPDYRGRVSAGLDSNAGVVNTAISLGTKIGEHLHTLTTTEMPNHNHTYNTFTSAYGKVYAGTSFGDYINGTSTPNTSSVGGGIPFSNIQPTIIVNKIIKYASTTIPFNPTSILNVYNPYYGRVFMAQGHSNLSDNLWTDLEINTVDYGNSLSSFNTTNYTFTCPITGVYRFSLGVQFTSGVVGDTVGMRLLKNGTSAEMTEKRSVIRNGTTVDLGVSDIIVLNAGDTIKFQAIAIGSSMIDVVGASYTGGGEDITHLSWCLETATSIVGTSNIYTQVNLGTTQTSSNVVMWAGSSNELLTTQLHITSSSNLGIGTSTALYPLDIVNTTAIRVPKGTTAQRPSNNDALIRYNTTTATFEGCSNNVWGTLGGSTGTSGGGDSFVQTATKTANYTAVKNDEVLVDTNGAAGNITISLPASPSAGDQVRIVLITEHATRVCLISRNGSSIDGRTATEGETYYTHWKNGDTTTFKYVGGSSGWISIDRNIANRFMIRAFLNAAQLNLASSQYVKVLLDTASYDYNNNFDTTNKKWTCAISGTYNIIGGATFTQVTADRRYYIALFKNNAEIKAFSGNSAIAADCSVNYVDYIQCSVGDYFELYVYQTGATTVDLINTTNHTYFTFSLVSR